MPRKIKVLMKTETLDIVVDYVEEDAIVHVKVSGIMDFEGHRRYAEKTLACDKEHNTHKIFVDMLDMIPQLSAFEIDGLATTMIDCGATPEHRIAVLHDPPPPHDVGFAFFRDTAAVESLQIRKFPGKDEALAWLKSEP